MVPVQSGFKAVSKWAFTPASLSLIESLWTLFSPSVQFVWGGVNVALALVYTRAIQDLKVVCHLKWNPGVVHFWWWWDGGGNPTSTNLKQLEELHFSGPIQLPQSAVPCIIGWGWVFVHCLLPRVLLLSAAALGTFSNPWKTVLEQHKQISCPWCSIQQTLNMY